MEDTGDEIINYSATTIGSVEPYLFEPLRSAEQLNALNMSAESSTINTRIEQNTEVTRTDNLIWLVH